MDVDSLEREVKEAIEQVRQLDDRLDKIMDLARDLNNLINLVDQKKRYIYALLREVERL